MTERFTVAVVGGGQLARMMQEAAIPLGVTLRALVETADGSAGQVIPGAFPGTAQNLAALRQIAGDAYSLTVEHEHLDREQLAALESEGVRVYPGSDALHFAQDKIAMRARLSELNIEVPAWEQIETAEQLQSFGDRVGWPVIVKTPRGGYDGKGVRLAQSTVDVADWLRALESDGVVSVAGLGGHGGGALLVEEYVPFSRELTALVARRPSGEIRAWDVVETVQANGVCSEVLAPAPGLAPLTAAHAQRIAIEVAEQLEVVGVLAVELFIVENQLDPDSSRLVVNELAMRPHNSGHWTIDGATTSQFEQHLRAVLDLPLGETTPLAEACVMVNLLGSTLEDPREAYANLMERFPGAKVHLYGKEVREGRKLGHVTVSGTDVRALRTEANAAVALLRGE